MKTSELTGPALDWAVAKYEGYKPCYTNGRLRPVFRTGMDVEPTWPNYSTDWSQGGPIIEREGVSISRHPDGANWMAWIRNIGTTREGSTPLIAAMRCFVASKLGDAIEIPKELQ